MPKVAERESRSLPVIWLVVKPSRAWRPSEKLTPTFDPIGPLTLPRTSRAEALPNGATTVPVHPDSDGRALLTLMIPPSALRPYSGLCGPRTNSIWETSSSSMLEELTFSCGTPS